MWATDPRRRHRRLAAAVLAASGAGLFGCGALAQVAPVTPVTPQVSDADIERARHQHRMPTDAELARIPVPAAPRIDALPQPATVQQIDLEALAKGFEAQVAQPTLGNALAQHRMRGRAAADVAGADEDDVLRLGQVGWHPISVPAARGSR